MLKSKKLPLAIKTAARDLRREKALDFSAFAHKWQTTMAIDSGEAPTAMAFEQKDKSFSEHSRIKQGEKIALRIARDFERVTFSRATRRR